MRVEHFAAVEKERKPKRRKVDDRRNTKSFNGCERNIQVEREGAEMGFVMCVVGLWFCEKQTLLARHNGKLTHGLRELEGMLKRLQGTGSLSTTATLLIPCVQFSMSAILSEEKVEQENSQTFKQKNRKFNERICKEKRDSHSSG